MAEAELRNMIMNFRVSDLQVLLGFAGRNKTGKKQELQGRALDLVKIKSPAVDMKVRELHNRRYHHMLATRNYERQDRPVNDHSVPHYEPAVNNNYAVHCNTSVRPASVNQGPSSSYSANAKSYLQPMSAQSALPRFDAYPDVKFKDLPFYDVLYVLIRPTSLVNEIPERYQENKYHFTLTPQQAHDIAVSKDASGDYECQVLLRFCLLETSCEQEDNIPPSICIKVNDKTVQLPSPIPTNRPGVEPKRPSKPLNITNHTKISPTVRNSIYISWASTYGRSYVFALYIARQLTSMILLERLKANGVRNPDHTTAMIKEKLQQGQDAEIATTSLRGSLICPLGKIKMELPCRSITCTHLQCFDAFLYIQMNEKKPKWICPVCDRPALFRTLAIDGLFMDIASKVPSECTEVQFHEDGSWAPVLPVKEPKETKKTVIERGPKKSANANKITVELVDLSSDSDSEEVWSFNDSKTEEKNTLKTSSESSPVALSPPVVFLPTDTNVTVNSTPVSTSSYNTTCVSPVPETLALPSNGQAEPAEHLTILPDLITSVDNSMPSTSSSPGLGSVNYPHLPFISTDTTYCPPVSNAFQEQIGLLSNNQHSYSNGFDFFSLLQIPESEQQ
ncbi:E3 SUMO-protein ligase PIAS2, partial [Stegodyphus mimosarum]